MYTDYVYHKMFDIEYKACRINSLFTTQKEFSYIVVNEKKSLRYFEYIEVDAITEFH